jgi:hypothetical protein
MLTQENLISAREEDLRKEKKLDAKMEDLKKKGMVTLQEKYETLKRRLKELLDNKQNLLQAPMTKGEILELSKHALRKYWKENSLEGFLVQHLQNAMERKNIPLDPSHVRLELFGRGRDDDAWKLVYWIITEKDLEKAASSLPDNGLAEAEREAQIKDIDEEISELEACLAKEDECRN